MAAADLGEKVGNIINSSLVSLALALAKDVGILHVLLEEKQPLTSVEIADKKQLKERYVREILGSLATAEVVHVAKNEAGSLVYHLEEEEKSVFRSALVAFISFPPLLATVYDTVKACLPKSGPYGTMYSERAHNCIEEFSIYNQDMITEKVLGSVEGLREKLENGIEVIEFGCGRGRLLSNFAQMFPKSTFIASEVVPSLLDVLKVRLGHIPNIAYEINDLCALPDPPTKKYDWIYCIDVIHDLPDPPAALNGIRKLVKEPGGVFTMIDIATSGSPIEDRGNLGVACLYAVSTFMCVPESFQRDDSHALGACWGRNTATRLVTAAGFNVSSTDLEGDLALFICKPSRP